MRATALVRNRRTSRMKKTSKHSPRTIGGLRISTLLLLGGFSLAALGSQVGPGVSAFFTDTGTVGTNTFTTGRLDIKLNGADSITGLFTVNPMAPGDSQTQQVTVLNGTNSLPLRYAISAGTATNADALGLKDALVLKIKTLGTSCATFDGTSLYDSTTGNDGIDGPVSAKLVGDLAQGAQAGDRALAATASESLCFQVSLPIAAANALQGATTTAQWVFSAEQTANNP
jgi:predicted ribosomally synthesized peptide with SipW-like signal peptide